MEEYWRKAILENVPHGEEGSLQCTEEEVIILSRLLLKKGYAICLTGGDIGDNIRVNWLYAGDSEDLDYPDYDRVVFTSLDYLEDYPEVYYGEYVEDEEREDK